MSRGKKAVLVNAVLALAVVSIWASPAPAALTMSGSVAAVDDRAPDPVTGLAAVADLTGPSVGLPWVPSASDFVRQGPAGLDLTSGGTFVNINDVSAYNIWRDDNGTGLKMIASVGAGEGSYVDLAVVTGITYVYQVTAADAAGNESAAVVSAPISLGPPPTSRPELPAVANAVAQVLMTFELPEEETEALVNPDPADQAALPARVDFIANFIANLARTLGIDPSRIRNVRLRSGSLVIEFGSE